MIQAVIFDMDGLMFDTERLAKSAWIEVGKLLGYPIDEWVIHQIRGATPAASKEIFSNVFGQSFDYSKAKAMRNAFIEKEIEKNGVPIKKGLKQLLYALQHNNIKCAVASSSPRKTIEKYLEMTNIRPFFDSIVGAENVCRSKPFPDVFLLAANKLGVNAENCLVLEDSGNGIHAAYAAQMHVICIPDLAVPENAIISCRAHMLNNLTEVISWIDAQNSIIKGKKET